MTKSKIKSNITDKKNIFKKAIELKEYPIFYSKHLTTNKKYNFNYFNNEKEQIIVKSIILEEILRLQEKTWVEWGIENKKTGYESIPITQINIIPKNLILPNDIKTIVFRINSQKWRLIGIRSMHFKSVIHIIGFDFDYTAYKH